VREIDRQRRFRLIQDIGCLACHRFGWYSPVDTHHQNLGGHAGQKRLGDESTIGLCPWHHRGILKPPIYVGPSLATQPRKFREVFGSDEELLAKQDGLIAEHEALIVGKIA
jgi:hypothetical protein